MTMMTFARTVPFPIDAAERQSRLAHPTRRSARRSRYGDGKLDRLAAVESLDGCRRAELEALAAAADLIRIPAGTRLAGGVDFSRQWWMVLDGWLLVEGDGDVARAIPAGSSWTAPRLPSPAGRVTAARDSVLLVAPLGRLKNALWEHPRLDTAIRATLVGGDV
jgi:hypothetical protein